jgi:hypothetical protein
MAKSNNKSKRRTRDLSKKVPSIYLHGEWLKSFGFSPDKLVHVIAKNGCIVLTLKDENLLSFLLETK